MNLEWYINQGLKYEKYTKDLRLIIYYLILIMNVINH